MTEVEDRNDLERRLAVSIGVSLKTECSRALAAYGRANDPVVRDAALKQIVAALTTSLSRQYEIGQSDPGSQFYITNYAEPRSPFDRHPTKGRER